MIQERREDLRAQLHIPFVLRFAQKAYPVVTHDISRSGALLQARMSFPVGTMMVLEHQGQGLGVSGLKVRLMARVINSRRGFPVKGEGAAMGVSWIRAMCSSGKEDLRRFLKKVFGFSDHRLEGIRASGSEAFFDFSGSDKLKHQAGMDKRGRVSQSDSGALGSQRRAMDDLNSHRYAIDIPVVFAVDNMHFKGRAVFVGKDGLTIVPSQALPRYHSRVVVRFPLNTGRVGDRVLLFGDVEAVVEAIGSHPASFSVKVNAMDEGDTPGAYRHFLSQRAFAGTQL